MAQPWLDESVKSRKNLLCNVPSEIFELDVGSIIVISCFPHLRVEGLNPTTSYYGGLFEFKAIAKTMPSRLETLQKPTRDCHKIDMAMSLENYRVFLRNTL